jgi:hypothetical protein
MHSSELAAELEVRAMGERERGVLPRAGSRAKSRAPTPLNPSAQQKFDDCVADFAADLQAEAERLEAGQSIGGSAAEITSTMVHDANIIVRRNYRQAPRSTTVTVAQLSAAGALIAVGVATNHLGAVWGQVLFACSVCIAMVATTITLLKENR